MASCAFLAGRWRSWAVVMRHPPRIPNSIPATVNRPAHRPTRTPRTKLPILPFRDLVSDGEIIDAVFIAVFSHRGFERGSGGDAAQVHQNAVDGVAPRAVLGGLHAVDVNIALLVGDFHRGPEGFLEGSYGVEVF